MKNAFRIILLILLVSISSAACASNPTEHSNPNSNNQSTDDSTQDSNASNQDSSAKNDTNQGSENPNPEDTQENNKENNKQNQKGISDQQFLNMIKEEINLGMNAQEVERLLGNDYEIISNARDDSKKWRYDFGIKKDHSFLSVHLDAVDVKGLLNGDVEIQLFVEWGEDGKVKTYSVFYNKDQQIYAYKVLANGEVKEEILAL